VSVGEEAEALLGYAREEFLSASVQLKDRVHPEDAGLAEALFSQDSTSPYGSVNLRIRHSDGRIRCLKTRYAKAHAQGGGFKVELWMEDARKVSEPGDPVLIASFKTLVEQTDDFVYVKNRNHVILAASRTLPNLTESARHRAELVGKTDYDLHPEEAADEYYRLEEKAFADGRRANQIQQVQTQEGTQRWIDNRKYPINGPGGEIVGVLGIAPDITEYVEAERRLRESEESLRQAQKIAGLGSYSLDILSGVWTSSDILDEIFGIDRAYERTVGGWLDLIHPDDRLAMSAYFEDEVLGQGKPFDKEYRIVRLSDGVERWVHGIGKLTFDAQGRPVAMHGTIQDITERKQVETALRESQHLLQLFIKHAPAALAMLDREMRYLAVSRRWLEMHALGDADIIGRSHYEVISGIPESWREEHRRCLAGERVEMDERRLMRADGAVQWARREILPWHAGDGSVGGILIFGEDITERKLAEERLRLAATVFTGAREGILITDPVGTILEVNDAYTRITGYSREEVLGRNPRILQSGLQSKEFYEKMWNSLIRDGHWSGEIWNRNKNGDIYAEMLTIDAIRDAGGQVKQYLGLSTDITEGKQHAQQLELAAHYDALTGLPNRALLADRLRQAMAQAHRRNQVLGVAYFDLDGFKAINDVYGHSSGDALLTALAFRMKRALRAGDTLARLGGDEFAAVILDLPGRDACLATLTRVLEAVAEEVQIGDVPLRTTASAGVTFYPQAEEVDEDVLLRQAGQALYEAKLAGKNRYSVFDPSHDLIARSRHENIEHVRKALAEHELVLYYQPKVNMRTGKVIGAEALIRWQHAERGLLPPGLFLPVIEAHPLAVEVGEWVIESALAQMEAWQESGFELPVSVNVSAFELQQPGFVDRLCARLAAHPRIKPSHLELEVLETSALQDVTLSSQVLAACREAGVQISVDDFGTGYSSLAYLKRLPANVLKIDQSFVRDMLDELESLTILKGVLGLAEAFRREVIAEGVETVDHGLMLLQLGCDCAQGYGIAKPMPAGELQGWAAAWHTDPRWMEAPIVHANNRAVLFAMVEHHAWYGHFLANLQGTRPAPPPLGVEPCSLSAWLDAQRLTSGGLPASIQAIEALHQQLHALAAEIYEAQARGRKQDGLGPLRQLRYLHERCMKRLQTFTRISSVNPPAALRFGMELRPLAAMRRKSGTVSLRNNKLEM
jgi:diguanylate cyclase (GGDEF)-like protein/PAS domain S-box-containing protein